MGPCPPQTWTPEPELSWPPTPPDGEAWPVQASPPLPWPRCSLLGLSAALESTVVSVGSQACWPPSAHSLRLLEEPLSYKPGQGPGEGAPPGVMAGEAGFGYLGLLYGDVHSSASASVGRGPLSCANWAAGGIPELVLGCCSPGGQGRSCPISCKVLHGKV